MSKTLTEMANEVRINLNRIDDGSTSHDNLIADIKTKIRSRYEALWNRRLWPETIKIGVNVSVPANETEIDLPSDLCLITVVKIGQQLLQPKSPTEDRQYEYDYINRGRNGIQLRKAFATAKTFTFEGKDNFGGLPNNNSKPCLPVEDILINIVTADFLRIDETDHARAVDYVNEANQLYMDLVERYEAQMANEKRIIPMEPFTDLNEFQRHVHPNTSVNFF